MTGKKWNQTKGKPKTARMKYARFSGYGVTFDDHKVFIKATNGKIPSNFRKFKKRASVNGKTAYYKIR